MNHLQQQQHSAAPFAWMTVAMLTLLAALAGCGSSGGVANIVQEAPPAPKSAVFEMSPGQTVAITAGSSLTLERVNDSRCKSGAVCVWQGYISYTFTLNSKTGSSSFVLSDAMPGVPSTANQARLTFTLLGHDPVSPPALEAPAPNYRVTLKVAVT